jgi:hypothetical protein
VKGGVKTRLLAKGAIVTGEMASWRVRVDRGGRMFIEKNGKQLSTRVGVVPNYVVRTKNLIGTSPILTDGNLDGCVFGLRVENV